MTVVDDFSASILVESRGRTLPAHITIKHWQLKNLLCRDQSGISDRRLLYCCRNSIRTFDPQSSQVGFLSPKLSFEPRSITSNRGYTIAGAENGTIAVIPGEGTKSEHDIGGSLVNGLHVYQGRDHHDRVLVSNNDYSLKFFNLHTMHAESPISLPAAMNSASTTADAQMMAAVGDSTEAYIFVNDSGRWRKYAEITVADDPCFSAVFSPSQRHLAIGSQDVMPDVYCNDPELTEQGSCVIFDVRKLPRTGGQGSNVHGPVSAKRSGALLHRAASSRPFPHGSIRTLAWSPSPLDMLLYTESTSFATIIDCRDFERQQRIRIPDGDGSHLGIGGRDREISGACWSSTGNHAYVGSEQGITEFKVKTKDRRTFPSFSLR